MAYQLPTFNYQSVYPVTLPGLRVATTLALQAMVIASLGDLNAALVYATLSVPMATWTPAQVIKGDPNLIKTSLICIIGAGKSEATDMSSEFSWLAGGSETATFGNTITTAIQVLLHKDAFAAQTDINLRVSDEEIALQTIADHLRKRVFNSMTNGYNIALASQEVYSSGDILTGCHVKSVAMGPSQKDYGTSVQVPSATLYHFAEINRSEA